MQNPETRAQKPNRSKGRGKGLSLNIYLPLLPTWLLVSWSWFLRPFGFWFFGPGFSSQVPDVVLQLRVEEAPEAAGRDRAGETQERIDDDG